MKKSFYLLIVCSIFVAFHFSGCEKEVKVSGISVEPKELYLSEGGVAQLAYIVKPYGADNKSVTWKSEDLSVATVSATGLVTAIAEGKTQITATANDGHFTDMVSVTVMSGSPEGDSIALVDLYHVATNLPYWDLTKPMDQWERVVLNSNRRVVFMPYDESYPIFINHPLKASIGNLTYLEQLHLGVYDYSGDDVTIPVEIGKLTSLQRLSFYNGFTGAIPSELGNLAQLKFLSIHNNYPLTGGIPPELGNLAQLEYLIVYGNISLTGNIPKELGNLTNLKTLNVEFTQLTGNIPKELSNITNLQRLLLSCNKLTGEIPQELENLTSLYDLELRNNSLSGTIPQSLLNRFDWWAFCPQNGTNFDNLDCENY